MVGLSLDEQESGGTAPIIFVCGNCLRLSGFGWYENYVDPYYLADSSLAIFGALLAQSMRASQRCLWSGWSSDADWSR